MACYEHTAAVAACRSCGRKFPSFEAARLHVHVCLGHKHDAQTRGGDARESEGEISLEPTG
jgi:hypothetical protein